MSLVMFGDSSACVGIVGREGLGKVKHVQVKQLWLQERIREEKLRMIKIPRAQNCSDAFTKHYGPDAAIHFWSMKCSIIC